MIQIPLSSREAVAGDQEQVKKDKGRRKRFLARPQIPNRVLRKRYEELPNKPRSTPVSHSSHTTFQSGLQKLC